MSSETRTAPVANLQRWGGYVLSGLTALFLLFDAVAKIGRLAPVVEATTKLGVPESLIIPIGSVLLIATVLYVIPRTSVLGAILLTGYLGGATAANVRAGAGWFPVCFSVGMGVLAWGGLYLQGRDLHPFLPLTEPARPPASKAMLWAGRVLSAIPAFLFILSGAMKVARLAPVLEGFRNFGYDPSLVLGIGVLELACIAIYLIPQTSVLGAILAVGYMGGATFTHLRGGESGAMTVLLGVAIWGGLYLRDERLRALIPLRSRA